MVLKLFFSTGVVLLLIWFVAKFFFPVIGIHPDQNLGRIIGSISLSLHQKLVFLHLQESILLLGVTEQNVTLVDKIIDPEKVQALLLASGSKGKKHSFSDLFRGMGGLGAGDSEPLPHSQRLKDLDDSLSTTEAKARDLLS